MVGRKIKVAGLIPVFLFLVFGAQSGSFGQDKYGRDTIKTDVKTKKTDIKKSKESDTRQRGGVKDSVKTDKKGGKVKVGVTEKDSTTLRSRRGGIGDGSVIRRSSDTTFRHGIASDTLIIQDTVILRGGQGDRSRGGFPDSPAQPSWNTRRGGMPDSMKHDTLHHKKGGVNDPLLNDQEQNKRRGGVPDSASVPPDSNRRRGGIIDTMMGPPELEPDDYKHRPDSLLRHR